METAAVSSPVNVPGAAATGSPKASKLASSEPTSGTRVISEALARDIKARLLTPNTSSSTLGSTNSGGGGGSGGGGASGNGGVDVKRNRAGSSFAKLTGPKDKNRQRALSHGVASAAAAAATARGFGTAFNSPYTDAVTAARLVSHGVVAGPADSQRLSIAAASDTDGIFPQERKQVLREIRQRQGSVDSKIRAGSVDGDLSALFDTGGGSNRASADGADGSVAQRLLLLNNSALSRTDGAASSADEFMDSSGEEDVSAAARVARLCAASSGTVIGEKGKGSHRSKAERKYEQYQGKIAYVHAALEKEVQQKEVFKKAIESRNNSATLYKDVEEVKRRNEREIQKADGRISELRRKMTKYKQICHEMEKSFAEKEREKELAAQSDIKGHGIGSMADVTHSVVKALGKRTKKALKKGAGRANGGDDSDDGGSSVPHTPLSKGPSSLRGSTSVVTLTDEENKMLHAIGETSVLPTSTGSPQASAPPSVTAAGPGSGGGGSGGGGSGGGDGDGDSIATTARGSAASTATFNGAVGGLGSLGVGADADALSLLTVESDREEADAVQQLLPQLRETTEQQEALAAKVSRMESTMRQMAEEMKQLKESNALALANLKESHDKELYAIREQKEAISDNKEYMLTQDDRIARLEDKINAGMAGGGGSGGGGGRGFGGGGFGGGDLISSKQSERFWKVMSYVLAAVAAVLVVFSSIAHGGRRAGYWLIGRALPEAEKRQSLQFAMSEDDDTSGLGGLDSEPSTPDAGVGKAAPALAR